MSNWMNFNDAERSTFDVIPDGTIAKVILAIKPGCFDSPEMGLTGGYATQSEATGSVYLECTATVTEGNFAKRKVWFKIGIHSPKGPAWGNQGRQMVRAILESARGIASKDESPEAQKARMIQHLGEIDGLEFVARIGVEKDQNGEDRNTIKAAIPKDHKDYAKLNGPAPVAAFAPATGAAWAAPQPAPATGFVGQRTQAPAPAQQASASGLPAWAPQ